MENKKYSALICVLLCLTGCNENTQEQSICGDGILSGTEICDGTEGVPASCTGFDPAKNWMNGGKPACASDCMSIAAGTCTEKSVCGDGIISGDEVCDGKNGVPETCGEYDSAKKWTEGGKPACAQDCMSIIAGSCIEMPVCGDGKVTGSEVCDGAIGVPETCGEFDAAKKWTEGGKPACAQDCMSIIAGSCIEMPVCGDGKITGSEVCDGEIGVPGTCSEFDAAKKWTEGGKPACAQDCMSIVAGSCSEINPPREFVSMNWNILFEWEDWGGRPVPARADKITAILSTMPRQPDIVSIVEASPAWHTDEIDAKFKNIGYVWADNDKTVTPERPDGAPLTNVIYKKDKYNCIEHGIVDLKYAESEQQKHGHGEYIYRGKTSAFYAVLEEIETGAHFIQFSTHWEANVIGTPANNDGKILNIVGWASSHELNRIRGAVDSAAKVTELRRKYPGAHVFYGGDFNTVDLDILIYSDAAPVLSTAFKILAPGTPDITDIASFKNAVNNVLGTTTTFTLLPDDFVGAHQSFADASRLTDARSYALENKTVSREKDTSTVTINNNSGDTTIPDVLEASGVPLVIDYAFYSADTMELTDYQVMTHGDGKNTDADYQFVSDHYPVMTVYRYHP